MSEIIVYKSVPQYWEKEHDGRKPNTERKHAFDDPRLKILQNWKAGDKLTVRIVHTETGQSFDRIVVDVSFWMDIAVISGTPNNGVDLMGLFCKHCKKIMPPTIQHVCKKEDLKTSKPKYQEALALLQR